MHPVLRTWTAVVFVAAAVPACAQAGRPSRPAAVAVNTVLDFRAHWLGDSTRVDACSVYRVLGSRADYADGLQPSLRPLLDRPADPCGDDPSRAIAQRPLNHVRVDSLIVSGDSTARAYLTVRKQHEQRYFETYDLGGLSEGGWVRDVRIWGIMRDYPVRPRRTPSPPAP